MVAMPEEKHSMQQTVREVKMIDTYKTNDKQTNC